MRLPLLRVLSIVVALAGCDLGPHYARPTLEIPGDFRSPSAAKQPVWPDADWWHAFRSSDLDALEAAAQAQNFDIAVAIAQVRQADAQIRINGAPLLPTLTGNASGNFAQSNVQSGLPRPVSYDTHQYSAGLDASYTLDFWGKTRGAVEAATASAQYSRFDQATVALTVVSSVATTYFSALAFEDRLTIAEQNLRESIASLDVIRGRLDAGTATALDEAQQEALVAGVRAAIPSLQSQMQQQIIGLGILTGRPPEAITITPGTLNDMPLPLVGPGLPSELLARRPDVAAAEEQLISANANIKVARAAFFPNFSLTASGGLQSLALNSLVGPGSTVASLAGTLTQTIFDNGTLSGQLELARGTYDQLLASYRKAVVQAFTDVENALNALHYAGEQEALERAAVATAQRAADIARAQLAAGTVDVTTLLTAEQTLFNDQDSLAQVRLSRIEALVNLYQALGGGWTAPDTAARRAL
jgi:NodT family efflux transporter outer membrane factor (OMF) lipoprotein